MYPDKSMLGTPAYIAPVTVNDMHHFTITGTAMVPSDATHNRHMQAQRVLQQQQHQQQQQLQLQQQQQQPHQQHQQHEHQQNAQHQHQHHQHLHRQHALQPSTMQQHEQQQQHAQSTHLPQSQHLTNQQHQLQQQQKQPQQQQSQQQQQQQTSSKAHHSTLFTRFDASKSTKGASKLRRDLINAEIANLRDLLPLPQSTRQRLSQLQLMALVCVYVRKANYFQQVFKRHDIFLHRSPTPNIGFSKALSGFLMMLTQNGKLLYISDNAAEYLGHSMEDLLIHGDSVYDIIDKQDHAAIQAELNRSAPPPQPGQRVCSASSTISTSAAAVAISNLEGDHRIFLCRMNVSRNARRQMRFGDQKVVLVQGHYLSFLPLCSRNEPVFLATCTPIAMPETRECVVQGATNVFTAVHSMDMKIIHIDKNGEFHLGFSKNDIQGISWYSLIHSDQLREAQSKHRLITQSEQDRSCILLVRMQRSTNDFIWVHIVLQVRDPQDSNQQPVIVSTNQVLNEREASIMILNSWLYHYYTVQSKIQFGLPYDTSSRIVPTPNPSTVNSSSASYYHHLHHHHHHHTASGYSPYAGLHTSPNHHHHSTPHHHFHNLQQLPSTYHSNQVDAISSVTINIEREPAILMTNINIENNSTPSSNDIINRKILSKPCGIEPVDYSQLPVDVTHHTRPLRSLSPTNKSIGDSRIDIRCDSANSSISSSTSTLGGYLSLGNSHIYSNHNRVRSPPQKRKAMGKLEPLYIQESSQDIIGNASLGEFDQGYLGHANHTVALAHDSHPSVIFATVVPTRPRLLNKMYSNDPADFMDQWNPSPPWSESAQKLSFENTSSSQQELSPCITTTPPTPTNAPLNNTTTCIPGIQTFGSAFSFEWTPEPLLPIGDTCLTYQRADGMPMMMKHTPTHAHNTATAWPSHVIAPSDHYGHIITHHVYHPAIKETPNNDMNSTQLHKTLCTSPNVAIATTNDAETHKHDESQNGFEPSKDTESN